MPTLPQTTWLAVAGGLLVVAVVLLVLWLVTVRRLREERRQAAADDRYTAQLQVAVACPRSSRRRTAPGTPG
jgi:HAMP domain-containing protein